MSLPTLTIDLGLGPPIKEQLRSQGFKLPGHATASLQRSRMAIVQLRVTGLISRSAAMQAEKRLIGLIRLTLKRHGKLKATKVHK